MAYHRGISRFFRSPANRVALGYGLLGFVWILLSDDLILTIVKDPTALTQIQTYKGWVFVSVSSLFIWVLLQRETKLRNVAWNRVADSEQRFRHALRNSPILISHQDLELRYTWVYNPSPSFDEASVIGKTDEEVFKPNDATNLTQLKRQVLATGNSLREALTLNILGSSLYFDITIDPLTDSEGNRAGVSCTAVDITERVRTREDLVEVERKLEDIVLHSTNLFYSHTTEHVLTYVSPQSNHFLGCEPAEAMRRWTDFTTDHPANQWALAWTQKAIDTARPQPPYELQLKTKDGRLLWVEVNEAPVVTNGKTVAIVGSLTDITDRKEKQRALAESESKYRNLIDHSPDAVMVNLNDRIAFVNRSCLTLFKAEHESQLLGKSPFDLFHAEFHDQIKNRIRQLRELNKPVPPVEEKIVCLDGQIRDVEVTAANFKLGEANAIHVILRDITERKINQAVLQRLSIAVEGSGDIIFMTDPNGVITYVNNAFVQTYGYSSDETVGKLTPRILKSGKTDPGTYEQLWASIASSKTVSMRIVNRSRSGKLLQIDTSINPIVEVGGRITGYLAVQHDVTEQVEMHNNLIEKETLLSETEQLASIGGFSYDAVDGTFSYSDQFSVLTGVRGTVHHPRDLIGLIHKDDISQIMKLSDQLLNGVRNQEIDFRIIRPGGETRYLRGRVKAFRDEQSLVQVVGTVQDISQHKWAEEALKASEQKYREMIHWASVGIYQSTPDGVVTLANQCLAAILGYQDSDELLGRNLTTEIYMDTSERRRLIDAHVNLEHNSPISAEILWRKKNGSPIWVSLSEHTIRRDDGDVLCFEGFVTDISMRKEAESESHLLQEQLAQAQKLESLGTLAGGVAHDFNNILGIILGYSGFLRKNLSNPEKVQEGFDSINEAVQRGSGVVKQLLTFARKTSLNMEPLSINDEIRSFQRLVGATLPKSISFDLQLMNAQPIIRADRTQLHQVLLNLTLNARDAMEGKGKISITTDIVNGKKLRRKHPGVLSIPYTHIAVGDTGPGMDEDVLDRIFEPFFTTKEKGKGTGLGLPVTFGIVKSHAGFIDVQSIVGKSTVFNIYLPADSDIDGTTDNKGTVDAVAGGTETVLVFEDEDRLRKLLVMILQDMGYKVLSAAGGLHGLELFELHKNEIAAVITDLDMPGMNGLEVAAKIRALVPAIPIVLSSGYVDSTTKETAHQYGIREIIQKPFNPDEIALIIRRQIDSA